MHVVWKRQEKREKLANVSHSPYPFCCVLYWGLQNILMTLELLSSSNSHGSHKEKKKQTPPPINLNFTDKFLKCHMGKCHLINFSLYSILIVIDLIWLRLVSSV